MGQLLPGQLQSARRTPAPDSLGKLLQRLLHLSAVVLKTRPWLHKCRKLLSRHVSGLLLAWMTGYSLCGCNGHLTDMSLMVPHILLKLLKPAWDVVTWATPTYKACVVLQSCCIMH